MNNSNNIYLDLSREQAIKKSDYLTNEWTNKISGGLKIPAGSQIKIMNSFINYKGLAGDSIEILEDEEIKMNVAFYISHSDVLAPKSSFYDTGTKFNPSQINYSDNGESVAYESQLLTIYYNCFVELNYHKIMSGGMYNKLATEFDAYRNFYSTGKHPSVEKTATRMINLMNTGVSGYTEQPLFAVQIDNNGFLDPVLQEVVIKIKRGIYGIAELSNVIQDQINGKRTNVAIQQFSDLIDKTQQQVNYEIDQWNGNLQSQFLKSFKPLSWAYTPNATQYTGFEDIITNSSVAQLSNMFSASGDNNVLFITAKDFNYLMESKASTQNQALLPNYFKIGNFIQTSYLASIKETRFHTNDLRPTTSAQDAPILIPPKTAPGGLVYDGTTALPSDYWDYKPITKDFYLGTSSFQFTYDTETNGFSFTYLHEPYRLESVDLVGNTSTSSGQEASLLKQFVLEDILKTKSGLTDQQIQFFMNTMLNPKSRLGGVCIYNMDINTSYTGDNYNNYPYPAYARFSDFYSSNELATKAWENTFWNRLGFTYNQFNNIYYFERVASFDLDTEIMYGITTNNIIDVSAMNTISTFYCPDQTKDTSTKINTNLPYALTSQVKGFSYLNVAKNIFGYSTTSYKTGNYVRYTYMKCYPVLTGSNAITAPNLPILSNDGYFLITSDIIDGFTDIIKKNTPISLLGVASKSTPSNQDFISSFQEIIHTTSQDLVIDTIKIKILNSDLTNPILADRSSVLLQITLNEPQTPQEQQDKKSKK